MEQIALEWEPLQRRYVTVSEFADILRSMLDEEFGSFWIAGEISGCKFSPAGHYYFTLKDEGAQLRCACFRGNARFLKFKPVDGIAVLARGKMDLYKERGDMQFIVEAIEPQGHGALQLAFEQLKKRLGMEGLFEAARKRPLPKLPARIGLVTSPTGAVIRDMVNVLSRRFPGLHIRLYPALVQGEGSVEAVCRAIEFFSRSKWAEVVIVARGGGSLEDLWTFNDEAVARAIADCSVPVISAIGHETDFTIADFVADLRAPTPSAAAELVICTRQQLLDQIAGCAKKLEQLTHFRIAQAGRRLHEQGIDRGSAVLHRALARRAQRVDESDYRLRERVRLLTADRGRSLGELEARLRRLDVRYRFALARRRIEESATRAVALVGQNIASSAARLGRATEPLQGQDLRLRLARSRHALQQGESSSAQLMRSALARGEARLTLAEAHLSQLSPLRILERGYAIVENAAGVVKSAEDAPVGSEIGVRLAGGSLRARVTAAERSDPSLKR